MPISEKSIQEVKDALDIVDVVSDYVDLKKNGNNWWGLCPFHQDNTPSFSVAPNKNFYHCFVCKASGDSIKFVQEIEGISYIESIRKLAQKFGVQIQETQVTPEEEKAQKHKESLHIVLKFAQEFFYDNLMNSEEGKSIGLSYFKERGFREGTIEEFGLGYTINDWHAFEKAALEKGYQAELLKEAGLIIQKEGGKQYDRFRGRVIFPIHDLSGRPIAFGARTLKKDEKPKYLNSPETPVYHKGQVLYGLFQAKNEIRQKDNCYLVEGYTDVITLYQAGIHNVVATSGTALTEGQIKLIKRFTENVTVLYDGDDAGIKASLRGTDLLLEQGLNVRAVRFPDGEDPDSYCRGLGGEKFQEYLEQNHQDFILFKTNLQLDEALNDPIKKAAVTREIVESISKIPDPIKQSFFYKECSSLLQIDEDILKEEGRKIAEQKIWKEEKRRTQGRRSWEPPIYDAPIPTQDPSSVPPPPPMDYPPQEAFMPPPEYMDIPTDEAPSVSPLPPIGKQEYKEPEFPSFVSGESINVPLEVQKANNERLFIAELEMIRVILEKGTEVDSQNISVLSHIIEDIGDAYFISPTLRDIFNTYKNEIIISKNIDIDFFKNHSDPLIRNACKDILKISPKASRNWLEKFKIFVPEKDEDLEQIVFKTIAHWKYVRQKYLFEQRQKDLMTSTDFEEQDQILKELAELKNQMTVLANDLGYNDIN
ncbi:DNA primase [Sediminitomix flava]|uniref:DNA primase n=1 Tax=Sediminitomix flava TaxID=379075 RepID=A0A315Z6I6_SEDFL|nr:DNA primase [Sediminitomix flava]PWJ39983.1 DNA primase [Sediminitomix flava]